MVLRERARRRQSVPSVHGELPREPAGRSVGARAVPVETIRRRRRVEFGPGAAPLAEGGLICCFVALRPQSSVYVDQAQ